MPKLYITRHGETEWNIEGRMQGRKNSLLTPKGREQARWLSTRISEIPLDLIISSPSPRTLETAEIIRGEMPVPIIQDEHFLEMNVGRWEGVLKDDIEKLEPERSYTFWNQPHLFKADEGEDFYQVRERVLPWLKHILSTHKDKNILIVSHAIVLKILISYFERKPMEKLWDGQYIHGTSLTTVELMGEDSRIISQADTSHFKVIPMNSVSF